MSILNLTQHVATAEQVTQGVIEPQDKQLIQKLLTFDNLPTPQIVDNRARALADYAKSVGARSVMIGGAPYLMGPLEQRLWEYGIRPLYSFTERKSVERTLPDGSVTKTAVFVHIGFVGQEFCPAPQVCLQCESAGFCGDIGTNPNNPMCLTA